LVAITWLRIASATPEHALAATRLQGSGVVMEAGRKLRPILGFECTLTNMPAYFSG
jgi:hypothetical protein